MTHSWYFGDSTWNVVGILIRNAASMCIRTHLKRQLLLLVIQLFIDVCIFWQIACLCAVSWNHLPPLPRKQPDIFLLCLLMICKYSRAGKYMKSFCPKCLTQKTTIFAVPTLLWIVFFSHMRSISLLLVSLLFQEQATKVVRSNQGHGFLSPVPFALAKFWSFQCSVPWTLGKYNTLLKSLNSYCFLIIYVSMVSSCPSQGLRPYCSGNCTNK